MANKRDQRRQTALNELETQIEEKKTKIEKIKQKLELVKLQLTALQEDVIKSEKLLAELKEKKDKKSK